MGITVHYRGAIKDHDRIDDFEDRVFDLALELGGQAHIWRSFNDTDPSRVVRGVRVELCPGQETTSLLLSPEGWLIGLMEIEEAEKGTLTEMPWCWVKTQFGSLEGHVALVEMLAALKAEFFPDLEVSDEGGYWETRDAKTLEQKREFLQAAIRMMGEGLERFGMSAEAAEDPALVAARVERIAAMVHKTLRRPSEHPLVHWSDDDVDVDFQGRVTPEEEAKWDAMFKENRRRQERMGRAIEQHLSEGDSVRDAHEAAMLEETAAGLPQDPDDESEEENEDWRDSLPDQDEFNGSWDDDEEDSDESWKEGDGEDADDRAFGREKHPLQERATEFLLRLHELFKSDRGSTSVGTLMQGAMELSGGLAQALSFDDDDEFGAGLSVVQLKRSLRGAAFAIGALYPLRHDGLLDEATFKDLRSTLEGMQTDVYEELRRRRGQ